MKKLLSLLLIFAMCLGVLSACSGETTVETTEATAAADNLEAMLAGKFSVGYGCADVTPDLGTPLGGYNDPLGTRNTTGTGYPFHAVVVAFTDTKGETLLYVTQDLLLCYSFADALRNTLSTELNIDKSHIMVHCDHNHNGPDMSATGEASIANFINRLSSGTLSAARAALADRKPVTDLSTTFTRLDDVNYVRHYLLADGNYQAEGVGAVPKNQLIGHATVADNLLQVAKFTREGGKPVVLMNWQGHPPGTDPKTIATGNYYSVMRSYVDKNMDCHSMFILSGSGNLNNNSQITTEAKWGGDYVALGEGLGKAVIEASANFTPATLTGDMIVTENEFTTMGNSGMKTVPLYAISMGDFAIVTAPFEIFDTNAVAVRETSKFSMTFYSSCTNKSFGYLPTPMSFDWEIAYEVRITNFPKGTAEIIQNELIRMLDEQFPQTGLTQQEKREGYIHPEFVPKTDGKTYTNPVPGQLTAYTEVNNGFIALQLLDGINIKNVLCISADVAQQVLAKTEVQLIFNEQNVIIGVVE